ncbi:MAG: glycoside hydrolase family 127 protein [Alistipes sp.]|nr:glycoside hydrolase family 127 protein [Alistipes sp.]
MKLRNLILSSVAAATLFSCSTTTDPQPYEGSITQIPFNQVSLQDDFWLPRLNTQKRTLVPFSLEKTAYAVDNLRRVGAYLRGEKVTKPLEGPYYVASDLFKVMEGAAYLLTLEKDEALERQMDEIIDVIAAAQAPDGYLYEHHIMPPHLRNPRNRAGEKPYTYVDHSHELYNMGHMYEGAVAYYRATGKRKWLDVAEKNAKHINKVFFEGDPAYNDGKPVMRAPGHEEIELALVKLHQATGEQLYLDMAQKFLDIRGVTYSPQGEGVQTPDYAQQHQPVRDQREAVGHSVRAMYLYSGMADVVAFAGDETMQPALDAIWHDIVDRKMHITGGLGAVAGLEKFGPAYVLPNMETYDETCAAVGNVFFNYRMFLMSGDAKYLDVAEVALYNNVLAGVNLAGNRFFYVNPLETDGERKFNHGTAGRAEWFSTACCPSNLARLIPQVSGMIYSHAEDNIYCGFYIGSETSIPMAGGNVTLKQQTAYPFDGNISIEVTPQSEGEEFTLWLRVPTWSGEKFVPGELYDYADENGAKVVARINGRKVRSEVVNGFIPVRREWKAGDRVELELPMPVRYSVADERVEADRGRVCITRGPLVFCAEEPDNAEQVSGYVVDKVGEQGSIAPFAEGIMKGIPTITIDASDSPLKLIPYYSWNNRGDGTAMNVWFKTANAE